MKYLIFSFLCCLGITDLNAQDINMQNGTFNQCSGSFFDSGGPANDYGNGESFVLTICPDAPNLETVIEFTAFLLNNDGGDFLSVYNSNTNDPTALIGTYAGTLAANPELALLASTHPSGCLTFEFTSNVFFSGPGWEASISCRPPCQSITPEIIDISPICTIPGSTNLGIPINTAITFDGGASTSSGTTTDLTYEWTFNGGTPLIGQSISQTFTAPGDYIVTLTVTDSLGCFGTINEIITVGDESISVDDNLFTLDELINSVLISGTCSVVNNINSPNNAAISGQGFESYGYFNKECSPFPFEEGIIMATTDINSALTPAITGGAPGWPGDPDLEALIQQPGNTNNATVIEFEFTPFVDEIQFNYIFASYEYPEFVCNFADTFAFILSGPGIPDTNDYDHDANPATPDVTLNLGGLNIALVPGTTTPVSPVNVHNNFDALGNPNCGTGQLGEFAFPQFYDATNSLPNMPGDILVDGRTRVLQTIPTTVVPGSVYTIKLAVADRGDTAFDSFVFIEGGSFELGANVGEDLVLDDNNAPCEGDVISLEVFDGIAPPGFTFQWTKDGNPIPGETGPTLDVTETGEYCIELQAGTDCDSSDCAFVEFIPVFDETDDITENLDLLVCENPNDDPVFDLTQNDIDILENIKNTFFNDFPDFQTDNPGQEPYTVTYYTSLADATNAVNPIPNPTSFTPNPLNFPVTIHYVVDDSFGLSCSGIGSFTLDVFTTTIGTLDDLASCSDVAGATTGTFDLTQNDTNAIGTNPPDDFSVLYFETEQDALNNTNAIPNPSAYTNTSNPQTIWVRLDNDNVTDCFATGSFLIEVFTIPEITIPPIDLSQCGDFSLSQTFDLTVNNAVSMGIALPADAVITYHNTQADADTNVNAITDPANYLPANTSETIFIRVESIDSADCFSTDSFEIDIFDVEITTPADINICTPTANTGITTFDLSLQNNIVFGPNQDPTTHSLSYHTSLADANAGANPIPNPATYSNTTNPETIWVRVQNIDNPNCFEVTSFEISVTEEPVITLTPNLSLCGDFSLTQAFDLTQNDAVALGILNAADVVLAYFNSQTDADTPVNAIANPTAYIPGSATETIWVRAENVNDPSCYTTASFQIDIFDVEAIQPPDLSICDQTGGTGQSLWDLIQQEAIVLGPNQDVTTHNTSYHNSNADATANANAIPDPANYTNTATPEEIWVRVENATDPSCFAITNFNLIVVEEPEVTIPAVDLSQCGDFTGTQAFDLTVNNAVSLGVPGAGSTTLTYHTSQTDADTNANAITDPANYIPTAAATQTIYIRLENTGDSTCFGTTSFLLNIFDVEAIQPPDLSLCAQTGGTGQTLWDLTQQDAVILGPNQDVTTHNTSYHNSNADATANTNAIPDPTNYTNTATPEEIWVRVENATDPSCFAIISFNLIVVEEPEVTIPAVDLSQCGDFSLTQAFDLTVNNAVSLGVPDAAGTVLSYHTSLADADTNANAITDPANYIPTAATQTIYIRLENAGDGTCFITTSFNITIFDVEAIQPPDLSLCAQTGGTGQTLWDLTQQDAVVLGPNQDVTTHNTSYHNSNADATANTNAIPDPANYTNTATPEEIWVRVENATDPSCFAITSFNLTVVEQPEVTIPAVDLSQCGDFTGTQPFDLTLNDLTSLGVPDAAGTILTYHNDPTDANTGSNPIANPTLYLASSNPETIYIRLENAGDNSCFITESFVVGSFDVEAIAPSDIESCDDGSGNGTAAFDLTSISAEALGSNQTLATHNISFHLSIADADANVNPIPNPSSYVNLTSPQDIFIRIENQLNPNCYAVTSFQLIVSNSDPINLNIDPLVACDDDNDGFFNNFDLTTLDDIITIGNTDIIISYHLTLADAINNVGVLASPYSNVVQDQQEIFIRALDTNNGCEQFGSFFIQVVPSPLLTPIQDPLVGCDDDFDGVLVFDLTEVEAEALGTLDPANLIITYHTSLLGAQTDTDLVPIPTAFQNTSSPQSIWIKVVDTSNNSLCFDIQEFQIIVEALPTISNPEPLEVCDDNTGGDLSDEIATFDLNDAIDEITLGNNELNVQFFETEDDLLNNIPIDPIDAYVNTTNPQTLEILVTASTNGCSIRTTITLAVNPVPSLAPLLDPIEICDPDNDGFAEFDLQDIIEDILNNEPEVSITFHLTAADAELGVNPIDTSLPFGTSNNDTQTIYVRATNTGPNGNDGTECFDTRPLDLIVVPSPEIENLIDLSRCDDDTPNGFASFDLTINTPEAIGTQNDTQVTYHETQADAEAGTNAIAVPTNYTNITNPQTIYVRIEDLVTGCVDLFDSIGDPNNTFTLTVEALPVVFTPTALEICDDDYNQDPFPQTVFDLTVKEPEIVGQTVVPANLVFTYFESQDDLDNGVAITDPTAYTNTAQPQTIFITVQDTDTQNSCTTTVLLTINVLPLPSPSTTDPDVLRLTGCDDDNDGVAIDPFDLTFSGNFIAGSENVLLSYYLNEDGAINEDPADLIADPTAYVNDPALNETDQNGLPTNVQIIYVRVDNNVAGNFCFVIVPFELVVLPNPELNPEGDPFAYTLCADDETSPENATLFSTQDITNNLWDLTDGASNIIIPLLDPNTTPVQNIEDFVVTYHTSEQDAEDGVNAISPGYVASNGEILFIRVTNIDSQCFNTNNIAQVQIIIEPRPNIAADNPDELVVCADDFQQGIATIDLTLYDDLINPGTPNNTQVLYYEGQANYDNRVFITDPVNYTTIQTPTTIIAEVINTLTGCESSRTLVFDIIVNPIFGDISGFDGVILCVDASGNAIFNEISPPVIDTELSEAEFSFEWALDGVPLPDTTPSITPTLPGLYTVVVTHLLTGCQANSSANVIPNQAINFNVDVVTTAFSSTHAAEVNTITGNGDFEFRIDDGPWIQLQPGQTTLLFTNLTPGMHTITGRDQGGCGEVSIEFMFIDYPPFFTPNQDGFNDTWNISTLSGDEQATVYIFDRYGKLLKQISPRGEGWDGTYNGKAMPSQDYWFRVEFIEPTTGAKSEFKAHFTLKR